MTKTELARRIRESAYLEGDFTLRSGRKSKYYLDKYLFETQPDILLALGERFAEYVRASTTLIAGAELGGVALAAAASMASGKPFVIIRNAKKDYGTSKPYEGKISASDSVLLVEDIATTGGQVLEAAKFITSIEAKVERIVAVIDRQEGARENIEQAGFKFESLFTKADLGITG
ncbi:MAG: orotate phosphoribosyltransferase [Planctomycetes bacterium]|nr:orotate phosphoribosyltransferase [Planctomycetota bacterium]MBI3833024.1 orotate phosphoribosyltransferase [Planctomycetota bacterium]